jgi:hypothetical protein
VIPAPEALLARLRQRTVGSPEVVWAKIVRTARGTPLPALQLGRGRHPILLCAWAGR